MTETIHPPAAWPGPEPSPESGRASSGQEFLWGVATSAYQHEGGFNGGGKPQNNWTWAEQDQTVDPTGEAAGFWKQAEKDFARCQELGLNAFRLSLAWERIQPTFESDLDGRPSPDAPPPFDEEALDRYADILCACRRAGLEPVVTLHHFTHPAWLGLDAWLILRPSTIISGLLKKPSLSSLMFCHQNTQRAPRVGSLRSMNPTCWPPALISTGSFPLGPARKRARCRP